MDELTEKFSLERVGSTAAVFDNDKLLWMNGHYIRSMESPELVKRIEEFIGRTPLAGLPGAGGNPTVADLVPLVQEKMKTLVEFVALTDFFFLPVNFEEKALNKLKNDENVPAVLKAASTIITETEPFDAVTLEAALRARADEMVIKLGKFLQPIRIAVSGKTVTPGMFETLAVLGKEESLKRLAATAALIV
jgi:glutamyl/glutaminyl-tRNA synthetase